MSEAELDGDEYGYVVNVVTLVVRYLDHETNAEIISTKTLGTDLSKLGEIYVQNVEATYTAPRINAYRALEETIAFIPTSASYELKVLYQSLKKPPVIEAPMKNFPYDSTIDAEALLQDVKATDLDGTDISDQLTVTPESLDGTQPEHIRCDVFSGRSTPETSPPRQFPLRLPSTGRKWRLVVAGKSGTLLLPGMVSR